MAIILTGLILGIVLAVVGVVGVVRSLTAFRLRTGKLSVALSAVPLDQARRDAARIEVALTGLQNLSTRFSKK